MRCPGKLKCFKCAKFDFINDIVKIIEEKIKEELNKNCPDCPFDDNGNENDKEKHKNE